MGSSSALIRSKLVLLIGSLCTLGLGISERPATAQPASSAEKTPCQDGTADGYPCQNVDLLSHLSIGGLGGESGTRLNDIWGWTDPQSGAEYAVVGRTDATAFVDVSDPTNPVFLGELPSHTGASTWRDVKVYQNHAYVVSEAAGHGLQVFDLTQLRSVDDPPVTVDETAHYDLFSAAHNVAINPESGYAYVVGIQGKQSDEVAPNCGPGLHMINLSTPDAPQFAGCFNDLSTAGQIARGYTHDTQCVMYRGPDADYQDEEICFSANENQINIANVTDKNAAVTITNATYPLSGYVHQAWLTEDQRYLFVDDELDEDRGLVDKTRTLVFDVSDLDNPELVKSFSGKTGAIDHNQYIKGRFAYQANYESGLRILDISAPTNPTEVGYFDTHPASNAAAFNGAWSTYPFFDSGIILVSSIGEGLFVLEPSFSFGPPTNLSVESGSDGRTVQLRWSISASDGSSSAPSSMKTGASRRYRIYRSTTPIDPSSEAENRTVLDSVSVGVTSYLDDTAEPGQTYYYRVTAVDANGSESAFSNEGRVFLYPAQISTSITRSFGAAAQASDYRLVALPGQAEHALSDAISGEPGTEWQAYLDDGSDENYFVRFDGTNAFTFRPGNGFWLTATADWTFSGDVPTVELKGDSVAQVPLREGWNVISNPTGKDVAWADVKAEMPGTLQALWGFDGSFTKASTFRSARTGRAYYFFNDQASRDSLVIPYTGAPSKNVASRSTSTAPSTLALTATPVTVNGASGSTVRIGINRNAKRGLGARDLVAPPGRFEPVSLRLQAPALPKGTRTQFLMRDIRPPSPNSGGQTFDVRLTSRVDGPVRLTVRDTEVLKTRSSALLHPAANTSYDAQATPITIHPDGETTPLRLAIGTEAYVNSKADAVLPDEVRLSAYPNPIKQTGTLEYTLPEAAEVTLRVYDVLGRRVATLAEGAQEAGRHAVQLKASTLSNGVYFGRLETGTQTQTQKMIVVR